MQIFKNKICSSLFCRVSDWKNISENKIIAKFLIGCNITLGEIHTIELREFYICLPFTLEEKIKQINDNYKENDDKQHEINK